MIDYDNIRFFFSSILPLVYSTFGGQSYLYMLLVGSDTYSMELAKVSPSQPGHYWSTGHHSLSRKLKIVVNYFLTHPYFKVKMKIVIYL